MPVIIRSHRRTIALIVENDGSVIIRAPYRLSRTVIDKFFEDHADWIREKQNLVKLNNPPPHRFVDGEIFYFLGKEYPLKIVTDQSVLLHLEGEFLLHEKAIPNATAIFTDWYREQAFEVIGDRLTQLARHFDINYKKFRISNARKRLGSCSNRGTLSFTWRLILAPIEVIDYIIIHELTHISIPNHSKQFWNQVKQYMPDYSIHKSWLKSHGKRLIL
jgi:predicted metal-dependent hydrolase